MPGAKPLSKPLPPVSKQVSSPRYCFFDAKVRRLNGLAVFAAGSEYCNADYHLLRADFPCLGMEFVASGRGSLVLNGQSFPLLAGSFFCYGPGIIHEISTDPERPMVKYFVNFFGTEALAILSKGVFAPGKALQTSAIDSFSILFDQLIAHGVTGGANAVEICSYFLRIILLKASDGIESYRPDFSAAAETFHRWRAFIDENYPRLHNLADIAKELHVRREHLCRLFKQFGHPGPFHYLTRKKLNLAAELLVRDRLSVKAAAAEAGYSDPYHFSRLFKAHFGYAPINFAQLNLGNLRKELI